MTKTKGYLIGRFSPLHSGHMHLITESAKQCDELTIFIGSANSARTIKNPWTYFERRDKILQFLNLRDIKNVNIFPQNDYKYNESQWLNDINSYIEHKSKDDNAIIFGSWKDGNDYLTWFPDWKFKSIEAEYNINATHVRMRMFDLKDPDMPATVQDDWAFYQKEKVTFGNYPFPETLNFNCSDAILECQGHVLLIQRKFAPGRGAWALPGGFRNQRETFLDCAIRELIEETNVRVPEKVLRGSMSFAP